MLLLLALILTLPRSTGHLDAIRAFHKVDDRILTSGSITLEQYPLIRDYGVKQVITLLPGDYAEERNVVESLGMKFHQIPVDFGKPTADDLDRFIALMKSFGNEKVFVHCAANMRVSAFVYVYRVAEENVNPRVALDDLETIWHPTRQWNDLVRNGLSARAKSPEWRSFHPFVATTLAHGIDSAKHLRSTMQSSIPKRDLINGANVLLREQGDSLAAISLYALAVDLYPDSRETWFQLGRLQQDRADMRADARKTYSTILKRYPRDVFAMQRLGELGVNHYQRYWTGVDYTADPNSGFVGDWTIPGHFSFTVGVENGKYTFRPQWMDSTFPLLKDPDGRYFVTRWQFVFSYNRKTGSVTFTGMDGDVAAHRSTK